MSSFHHDSALSGLSPSQRRLYLSSASASSAAIRAHSYLDEGFSEGHSDSEMVYLEPADETLQDVTMRAMDLPLEQRKRMVPHSLLPPMRTY